MTTPKKNEIIEKAIQIWKEDRFKKGQPYELNPEIEELKEEGFLNQAQSELMRDSYRSAIENKDFFEMENFDSFQFDQHLGLTCGTFISGGRGCGKSSLAKTITDIFLKEGYVVRVFDNSQTWRRSNIPNLVIVKPYTNFEPQYGDSYVFDISMLDIEQQKAFIENVVDKEFQHTANLNENERNWRIYVFEECEILISTHERSKKILRLCATGRNLKLSYIAISQRFQIVSTNLISMSGQLYLGMMHEFNDLKRAYNWIGNSTKELAKLDVGQFIRYCKGNMAKMNVELFTSKTKPKMIITESILPIPQFSKQDNGSIIDLLKFITCAGIVIYALSTIPK